MTNKRVFLGGTCNGSTWRDELIPMLEIDYFNPVVDDWDEEAYQQELYERENCDYCLYVITPEMTGFYSIAEVVDDSNKRPEKTIFCYLHYVFIPFEEHQLRSMQKIGKMIEDNGGAVCNSLINVALWLNREE